NSGSSWKSTILGGNPTNVTIKSQYECLKLHIHPMDIDFYMYTAPTLALNPYLLGLLNAVELARCAWMETVNHLNQASDEVWLAQMGEVERLEIQYRAHQD